MSEREPRYEWTKDISRIGLTQGDIQRRVVVATGYSAGELLPPYDDEEHQVRALHILAYFDAQPRRIPMPKNYAHEEVVDKFPGVKVIEVVGSYATWCVKDAVWEILNGDLYALVRSGFIYEGEYRLNDFRLGQILMRSVLADPNTRCLITGRDEFIFFDASKYRR